MSDSELLHENHRQMLADSAIDEGVRDEREYRTVTVKAELERLGFGRAQCSVPALLIPVWGPAGEVALYQARPDEPRIKRGKALKYETPAGSRMTLDVHPRAREGLGNPAVPLFVTEGVKKGDCLVSHGLCAVAVLGVWNWRGTNAQGGKVALADWETVALSDRTVYVVFDSDVMVKREVHQALERLSEFLKQRGAKVAFIYLPGGDGAAKQGVDDYLAAAHSVDDLLQLASPVLHAVEAGPEEGVGQESQADALVAIGRTGTLFHDTSSEGFAALPKNGHTETSPIRSRAFSLWLRKGFFRDNRQSTQCRGRERGSRRVRGPGAFRW